jgi:hypothetical protein
VTPDATSGPAADPAAGRPGLPGGARGRLLALGITAAALGLLWLGLVSPLLDWYAARQAALEDRRVLARHMADAAALAPRLQQQVATRAATGQLGLSDESDAVAAADLQEQLGAMAGETSVQIASSEVLSAGQGDGFRLIHIRVVLHAAWAPLLHLMQRIEEQVPGLIIEDLQLRSPAGATGDAPDVIDATFTVTGFRATAPAAAPAPG